MKTIVKRNKLWLILMMVLTASANASISMAPDFSMSSSEGKKIQLKDLKGKVVVLEWLNHGCPFVRKHYDSGNMQAIQKQFTDQGVVWLSIISSAPGKQGYSTPEKANEDRKKYKSLATHILIDKSGTVGRKYTAKVTPHMFIINKDGEIAYDGAIDSIASADPEDIKKAQPYVVEALNSLTKSRDVKVKSSRPYGCSIKY